MITCWECGHEIHNLEPCRTWLEENHSHELERVFAHRDCDRSLVIQGARLLLPAIAIAAGLANAGKARAA